MNDWKSILYSIYTPDIGSIWGVYNGFWNNSFAANKPDADLHPGLVGKVSSDKDSCNLVPGTTKDYRKGSCVYKVKLNPTDPNCPTSYFLIDLWITVNNSDLYKLKRGWKSIDNLDSLQLKDFILQIKFCRGISV